MRTFLTMAQATRRARTRSKLGPMALMLGLTLFGAGRAEAQYGPAAGFGYGAGMGMTLEDQALLKEQIAALNASQIQLNIAQAEREFWAAVLLHEQAFGIALSHCNQIETPPVADAGRRGPKKGASRRHRSGGPARVVRRIPPSGNASLAVARRGDPDPNAARP
jgi:hypothetical protein